MKVYFDDGTIQTVPDEQFEIVLQGNEELHTAGIARVFVKVDGKDYYENK